MMPSTRIGSLKFGIYNNCSFSTSRRYLTIRLTESKTSEIAKKTGAVHFA